MMNSTSPRNVFNNNLLSYAGNPPSSSSPLQRLSNSQGKESAPSPVSSQFTIQIPPQSQGSSKTAVNFEQSTKQQETTQQKHQPNIMRGSIAYVKMIKTAENTKYSLQKQNEDRIYAEKEKALFEQFHEFKHLKHYEPTEKTEDEDIELRNEMDKIVEGNRQKEQRLYTLHEKLHQIAEINEMDMNSIQRSVLSQSRQNQSSTWLDPEQLVYINSIQKMKKHMNSTMLSLKQSQEPSSIHETVDMLEINQSKIQDMIEVQLDTQAQLERKVEEIKVSLDMVMKEKNEVADLNQLFDKKFLNLELRSLNAHKKNEEAGQVTQQFQKELEDAHFKGMMILQEKQQEKSDIYSDVKFLKNEITLMLIQLDQKKELRAQQEEEMQKLEQKEQELLLQMNESKHLIDYISSIETLEKIFLEETSEEELEVEKYLNEFTDQEASVINNNNNNNISNITANRKNPNKRSLDEQQLLQSTPMLSSRHVDQNHHQSTESDQDISPKRKKNTSQHSSGISTSRNLVIDQNRNVLVERLNQFFENHQEGPMPVIDRLSVKLESLKVMSQSLHKRYQELIEIKVNLQSTIRDLDLEITKGEGEEQIINNLKQIADKTQDPQPQNLHEMPSHWIEEHTLTDVKEITQKKGGKFNTVLQEINSINNFEEDEEDGKTEQGDQAKDDDQSVKKEQNDKMAEDTILGQDSIDDQQHQGSLLDKNQVIPGPSKRYSIQLNGQDINTKKNQDHMQNQSAEIHQENKHRSEGNEERHQDVDNMKEKLDETTMGGQNLREISGQVEKNSKDKDKQKIMEKSSINQMITFITEKNQMEKNQIRAKTQFFEKFGFKIFLNQVETLFRLAQLVQDISRKGKSINNPDKSFEKLGDDLKKFASSLRKGVALKHSHNVKQNRLFVPVSGQPQVIRREDAKKFSFMEPLAQRFEKEKNNQKKDQIITDEQQQLSPSEQSYPGYLPTSVNENEKKQNKVEKYLELNQYAPLSADVIMEIFLNVFPNQTNNAVLFADAIKNDMFLSFFESKESLEEYLENIKEEQENKEQTEEQGSVQALKDIHILREESQKQHWKNIRDIFDRYLNFLTSIDEKIQIIWKKSSIPASILKKGMDISNNRIPREECKQQKKYTENVLEKLELYKSETQPLSDPITEYKAINLKDLEESAKENANTEDLKKIIFKLANSDANKKAAIFNHYNTKRQSRDHDDGEINLLDQQTKKQLMQQHMTEQEFLDFESHQVKIEIQGGDEHLSGNKNQSTTKLTDSKAFYQHKVSTSYQYLKSFVESDKVLWKIKQLENKKPSKLLLASVEDYLPRSNKFSKGDSFFRSKTSQPSQQAITVANSEKKINKEDESNMKGNKINNNNNNNSTSNHNISKITNSSSNSKSHNKTQSSLLVPISKSYFPDTYKTPLTFSSTNSLVTPRESTRRTLAPLPQIKPSESSTNNTNTNLYFSDNSNKNKFNNSNNFDSNKSLTKPKMLSQSQIFKPASSDLKSYSIPQTQKPIHKKEISQQQLPPHSEIPNQTKDNQTEKKNKKRLDQMMPVYEKIYLN